MKNPNEIREEAITNFRDGYNCAETVLKMIADVYGIKNDLIPKIATGFGGGMSRQGRECGAVCGAVMGFGALYGRSGPKEPRERTYDPVNEFYRRFKEKYDTTVCKELCGCDLSTPEGVKKFNEEKVHERKCSDFVVNAIEIFMKMVGEKP